MSDPQELHEMSRVVGGLQNAVETMTKMWARQDAAATQGRRVLHDKLEALGKEMIILARRVDSMAVQINLIEPSVKVFNDDRLREEGSKRLGKMLVGAISVAAGGIGWGVHEFIGYLTHK